MVELPKWLTDMANKINNAKGCPDNKFPHMAHEALNIVSDINTGIGADDSELAFCQLLIEEIELLQHLLLCSSCATDQPNGPNPALICRECARSSYLDQECEIEKLVKETERLRGILPNENLKRKQNNE